MGSREETTLEIYDNIKKKRVICEFEFTSKFGCGNHLCYTSPFTKIIQCVCFYTYRLLSIFLLRKDDAKSVRASRTIPLHSETHVLSTIITSYVQGLLLLSFFVLKKKTKGKRICGFFFVSVWFDKKVFW